jgi:esterase
MQLSYRDLGGGGRPPLVLLHGMLGSSRNWQTAGADLASAYHVLALDLRNHGGSPHLPAMSYDELAADVLAWMDGRGLARAAILGHSMGGKAAMLIACRHPSRVDRLVVVDVAPKDYPEGRWRREFAALNAIDLARLRSRAEAERQLEPAVPDWAMRKFLTTNLAQENGRWRWVVNLPAVTAALPGLLRNPLAEGDRYDGPARFIVGGRSRYVEAGDWAGVTRHFPAARLEIIGAAGHNPHLESREEFVRLVLAP